MHRYRFVSVVSAEMKIACNNFQQFQNCALLGCIICHTASNPDIHYCHGMMYIHVCTYCHDGQDSCMCMVTDMFVKFAIALRQPLLLCPQGFQCRQRRTLTLMHLSSCRLHSQLHRSQNMQLLSVLPAVLNNGLLPVAISVPL